MAKIKKTPTEIKHEALCRKLLAKKTKPKSKKKRKKKQPEYECQKQLRQMSYGDFLQSKYWAKVRQLVLRRDKFQCIICRSNSELQIHHDHYKNHFNELNHLDDLMTLCRSCHKEHHYAQN